ncbi:MAG: crossover junction endodeoxyribonuclease RuvC [Chlamydiales bacterium]|nr:crossover junction endodeoxyribonuclease RuvC [Chlamydiales bacterium]
MCSKKQTILGIDPGTRITGFGVISAEGNRVTLIDYGCIRPPASMPLNERYRILHEGVLALVEKYEPTACVLETQYVSRNVQSALKLGQAKGVALLAASLREIPIFEYAPSVAKLAVVGNGRASKEQVQRMVMHLLSLREPPTPEDAADALALALCHRNRHV